MLNKTLLSTCLLLLALICSSRSVAQNRVYWAEQQSIDLGMAVVTISKIRSANLDGSDVQNLPSDPAYPVINDLALDALHSKIYRIDSSGSRIVRSNLDGSNEELVQSGLDSAEGLAIDPAREIIFWSESKIGAIRRANSFPAAPITTLIPSGAQGTRALDLDRANRKLYWAQSSGALNVIGYDGSGQQLIDNYSVPGVSGALFGVSLDFNAQLLFSSLSFGTANNLFMLKQPGSLNAAQPVYPPGAETKINHLAVDPHPGGRIYWTEEGTSGVRSALRDGSSGQRIGTSTKARGIDLLLACDSFAPDSDKDGAPDCADQCQLDPVKSAPGVCGCGFIDGDADRDGVPDCIDDCPLDTNKIDPGVCGCGSFDNLRTATKLTCDDAPLLDENSKITEPPEITLFTDANGQIVVRIVFQHFAGARLLKLLKRPRNKARVLRIVLPASGKSRRITVRYDLRLRKEGAKIDALRYLTKRNELALRNLKPGTYSARYRALGTRDGKTVMRTNFSPLSSFSVP